MPVETKYQAFSDQQSRDLLEFYNPLLVLRPNLPGLKRPGALRRGLRGRGDYHPCSAEFFLDQVAQYDYQRRWWPFGHKKAPMGHKALRAKLEGRPCGTEKWELDIAGIDKSSIRFGSGDNAWREYQMLVGDCPGAKDCVTYDRCLHTADRIVLQYFYLYFYNDAANKHEGDWEMVAIELDKGAHPLQVGYSGHRGGASRVWEGVTRRDCRPVVFVARGAHAAYLEHMPGGHHTAKLDWSKSLPRPIQVPVNVFESTVSKALFFFGVRDFTVNVVDAGDGECVGPVSPNVKVFPEKIPAPGDPEWGDFWWMRLDCRWGSSRPRIREFIAPLPPWKNEAKWCDPLGWLAGLPER